MFLAISVEKYEIPKDIPDWWKDMYDIYVIVNYNSKPIGRTTTRKNNAHPKWSETILCPYDPNSPHHYFTFVVNDANRVLPDKLVNKIRFTYRPGSSRIQRIHKNGLHARVDVVVPYSVVEAKEKLAFQQYERDLHLLKNRHKQDLDALTNKSESRRKSMEDSHNKQIQAQLSALQQHHETEMQHVQSRHLDDEKKLTQQYNQLKRDTERKISEMAASHKSAMSSLQHNHDAVLVSQEEKHQLEMHQMSAKNSRVVAGHDLLNRLKLTKMKRQLHMLVSDVGRPRQNSI